MKIERVSEEEERELAMMKDAQKTRAVVEGGDDAGRPRAVAVADALTRYAVGGGASRQTGVTLRARRNAHAVKSRFCNSIGVGVTGISRLTPIPIHDIADMTIRAASPRLALSNFDQRFSGEKPWDFSPDENSPDFAPAATWD